MKSDRDDVTVHEAFSRLLELDSLPCPIDQMGVMIVDHGSQREESNRMLLDVVRLYRAIAPFEIVEPAHMELAEPSIAQAFAKCVERGATLVVVHPYFLLPGRHWDQDIPKLVAAAALNHTGVSFLVTSPLSLHPLMANVIQSRIEQCLVHAGGTTAGCELCEGTEKCQIRE